MPGRGIFLGQFTAKEMSLWLGATGKQARLHELQVYVLFLRAKNFNSYNRTVFKSLNTLFCLYANVSC